MRAAIIAIGSELLGATRTDTNSLLLARTLNRYGVPLVRKSVVSDDRAAIQREIRYALADADILILTGGLGPTEDDLTKESVAATFGLALHRDDAILERIQRLFEERGMKMPAANERQAMVFTDQKTIDNDRGTAPGFHLNLTFDDDPKHIWIFPGVPYELEGMIENDLSSWLSKVQRESLHQRTVKIVGMSESAVEGEMQAFYAAHKADPITILASHGEIHLQLTAAGDADEAYTRLGAMEQELHTIFGDRIFGVDDDRLEAVVGRLLSSRSENIGVAESCTGGLLSSRITDVSGSSSYFLGGVIAYSRDAKLFMLGVDPAMIDSFGEVSEEVATQMAQGARRRFGTTYGIAITGIAGPTGATPTKPVGTVHVAVASLHETRHKKFLFGGSRELVKHYSTQAALNMLRLMMIRSAR